MAKMPDVPLITLSIKPSPRRWALRSEQRAFDFAVQRRAARTSSMTYLDASAGLLVQGRPGPYFVADGIHMNAAGYRVWAKSVANALRDVLPRDVVEGCAQRFRRSSQHGDT